MASLKSFRDALVAIADLDAVISAITGRGPLAGARNLVVQGNIGALQNVGIGYHIVSSPQTGQNGEQRLVRVQFACYGRDMTEAEALAARLTEDPPSGMLIHSKLLAQGVDAVPLVWEQTDTDDTEIETDGRQEIRVMSEAVFEVKIS